MKDIQPERCPAKRRWVKADFHMHSAEDPRDFLDYTALELLETAHRKGFEALAITLHDKVLWDEELFRRARELGILLIPSAELRVEECDVVVLNLTPAEARQVSTFEDLRRLRRERGDTLFTIAPHPYFIKGGSMGRRLESELDCFDAVEYCHFHTWLINLNRPAERLARRTGLPVVATSDAHRLCWFGGHYSWLEIEGEPSVETVFAALRANRIRRHSPASTPLRFAAVLFYALFSPVRKWQRERRMALGTA